MYLAGCESEIMYTVLEFSSIVAIFQIVVYLVVMVVK